MPDGGHDHSARIDGQLRLRSARELVERARRAAQASQRLIRDAERLIPPVLCRCGTPLYAPPGAFVSECQACAVSDPDH